MISYLRSTHYRPAIKQRDELQPGSWIRSERPNDDEKQDLVTLGIDADILADALDPHEVPRVELEDGWTYFITRLPDTDDEFNDFTTPIMFALSNKYLVTVSRDSLGRLWQPFIDRTLAPTTQQPKLLMHMLDAIARQYQTRIATINRQMRATTSSVHTLKARDIATMTEYERKLNETIRLLTVITLTCTIPTMFAGLFGMNVDLPGEHAPYMFWIVIGLSALVALPLGVYFLRKR